METAGGIWGGSKAGIGPGWLSTSCAGDWLGRGELQETGTRVVVCSVWDLDTPGAAAWMPMGEAADRQVAVRHRQRRGWVGLNELNRWHERGQEGQLFLFVSEQTPFDSCRNTWLVTLHFHSPPMTVKDFSLLSLGCPVCHRITTGWSSADPETRRCHDPSHSQILKLQTFMKTSWY